MAIRALENEILVFSSIDEAYRAFNDQTKVDPNEKIDSICLYAN
jgi:hypothetical protein